MKKYKQILILLSILGSFLTIGCMNKVEVPTSIQTCFKDPKTGECTNQAVIKHVITIELPTVLTDSCKQRFNEVDFPDPAIREAGYQQCVTDYINQIIKVINGINPEDLPTGL